MLRILFAKALSLARLPLNVMFTEAWSRWYGDSPIVGHLFRERHRNSWFRVHSLPDSKRYAESDAERQLLLARHNELATNVLGLTSQVMVYWYWPEEPLMLNGQLIATVQEDEETTYSVFAASIGCWCPNTHDQLLIKIADDETSQVLFLNSETGNIYDPYDGGADVYIQSGRLRSAYKKQYSKWKSTDASGM